MTDAERQHRRRKKLRRERSDELKKKYRAIARDKQAENYMPYPPGITYWKTVVVQTTDGEREIFAPKTRPLAACSTDLEDDDILSLLFRLRKEAKRRGLSEDQPPPDPVEVRPLEPGESRMIDKDHLHTLIDGLNR